MNRIKPAAIAIIFNEDDTAVLLVKRRDVPIWVLPGGGIDPNESPEQAAIREAFEETGLNVSIDRQSGEYHPINNLASDTSVFVCHIVEGKPQISDESSDWGFFPVEKLPSDMFFLHRDWLNDARSSTTIVKRPIDQITYWGLLKYALTHPLQLIRFAITRFTRTD